MGIHDFGQLTPAAAVTLTSEDWTFHTIIADAPRELEVHPNGEVHKAEWLTADEIREIGAGGKLHPLMEAALPRLLEGDA